MRSTQFAWILVAALAVACSNNPPAGDRDSGTPGTDGGGVDAQTPPTDTGTGTDAPSTSGCMIGSGCDVIAQTCPMSGDACYFTNVPAEETSCRGINMNGVVGATCTATNDCGAGLACVNDRCREYCCVGTACRTAGEICTPLDEARTIGACIPPDMCDVITQEGCPETQSCAFILTEMTRDGSRQCHAVGSHAEGESCADRMGCVRGLACLNTAAESVCRRWCRVGMAADCPMAGTTCTRIGITLEGVEYGACFPMM